MNPETHATRADGCLSSVLWLAILGAVIVGLVSVLHPVIAARLDGAMLPALLTGALVAVVWWRP